MQYLCLKSFLLGKSYFQLDPPRWFSDEEVDYYEDLEYRWRKNNRKLNRYEANKLFFPRLMEVRKGRGTLDKEEIMGHTNMLDLYESYFPDSVPRRTSRRYVQVKCFRHDDKSPSMSVDTELKRVNCFSCGYKADCFGLVMEVEQVDFRSSMEMLSK